MPEYQMADPSTKAIAASQCAKALDVGFGVKSSPADHVTYTAEDPQKADRIAAAPRTVNVCQKRL